MLCDLKISTMTDHLSESHKRTEQKLLQYKECLQDSSFYKLIHGSLAHAPFKHVRCLALGSPTDEFQALYQLALLHLLIEDYKISPENVSFHDPAFTQDDVEYLSHAHGYLVEKSCDWDSGATLYYMPHSPRSLTEEVMNDKNVCWILGNDLTVTMGTLSAVKFLQECPTLATAVHINEKDQPRKAPEDGFTPVIKKKRKGRANKMVYVETELNYKEDSVYFEKVIITPLKCPKDSPWRLSFSDLAFNELQLKTNTTEEAASRELSQEKSST